MNYADLEQAIKDYCENDGAEFAARVEDQTEFDRFSDAYQKKYGRRPRNQSVGEAYLFRLTAR